MNSFEALLSAGSLIPFFPDPYHTEKYGGEARCVCFWEWLVKELNEVYTGIELKVGVTRENLNEHWGFLDYSGKVVLDIGADVGSTAYYFLQLGAKHVYAVEGSNHYYSKLERNALKLGDTTPIYEFVDSAETFECLLLLGADVAKIDIEGYEIYLADAENSIVQSIPEYIIEVHSPEIKDLLQLKFQNLGYSVSVFSYGKMSVLVATSSRY